MPSQARVATASQPQTPGNPGQSKAGNSTVTTHAPIATPRPNVSAAHEQHACPARIRSNKPRSSEATWATFRGRFEALNPLPQAHRPAFVASSWPSPISRRLTAEGICRPVTPTGLTRATPDALTQTSHIRVFGSPGAAGGVDTQNDRHQRGMQKKHDLALIPDEPPRARSRSRPVENPGFWTTTADRRKMANNGHPAAPPIVTPTCPPPNTRRAYCPESDNSPPLVPEHTKPEQRQNGPSVQRFRRNVGGQACAQTDAETACVTRHTASGSARPIPHLRPLCPREVPVPERAGTSLEAGSLQNMVQLAQDAAFRRR